MSWLLKIRRGFAPVLAVGLAAACAPTHAPSAGDGAPFARGEAVEVFAVGYGSITDKYIEKVTPSSLALEGMRGLASIDPELSVVRTGDTIAVASSGGTTVDFPAPGDSDVPGWAALTADVAEAGRKASDELRAASMEKIYEAVFDGALSNLDIFSRYAGAEEAGKNRARREGFGGTGIVLTIKDSIARVKSVMPGTPAFLAGVRPGDRITHVGDVPVAGLSSDNIGAQLQGQVHSMVAVTVLRDGVANPLEFEMERTHIISPTVIYGYKKGLAFFRITSFNQNTAASLGEKLEKALHEHGGEIKGLVLDMRGNPGGLLKESIRAADLFLRRGDIVNTVGRHPHSIQHYKANDSDLANGLPMAVLMDGKSASAAEVLAAALQDHGRAVIIGTSSYGKGTVQTVIRLPNSGEITLTWSRLIAPSGYILHGLGVLPAVCTSGKSAGAKAAILDPMERSRTAVAMDAWRKADFNDKPRREGLHLSCPAERRSQALEADVARRLLLDHSLYESALDLTALVAEAVDNAKSP